MADWSTFYIEVMKAAMKPGYLYGLGKDGELYCIEAQIPEPGGTLIMPPMIVPEQEDAS